MNDIARASGASPFDQIKHVDEHGNDYWTGRELQPLMEYTRWEKFAEVVEKAKASLALVQGDDQAEHHFATWGSDGGRWGNQKLDDYKLTRFGAYLTAMAGDDTKQAVAHARVYFATRTHQAEVAAQQRAVPASFAEALELAAAQQREIEAANAKVAVLEPKAAKYDQLLDADGLVGMTAIADMLDVDVTTLTDWLVSEGVFRKQVSEGQRGPKTRNLPRRAWQTSGHFEVHPERRGRVKFPVAYATSTGLDLIITKWSAR